MKQSQNILCFLFFLHSTFRQIFHSGKLIATQDSLGTHDSDFKLSFSTTFVDWEVDKIVESSGSSKPTNTHTRGKIAKHDFNDVVEFGVDEKALQSHSICLWKHLFHCRSTRKSINFKKAKATAKSDQTHRIYDLIIWSPTSVNLENML